MIFLLSSKSGVPEGFAPIPSSGELPAEDSFTGGTPREWVFFTVFLYFVESKGFTLARVQMLPPTS